MYDVIMLITHVISHDIMGLSCDYYSIRIAQYSLRSTQNQLLKHNTSLV